MPKKRFEEQKKISLQNIREAMQAIVLATKTRHIKTFFVIQPMPSEMQMENNDYLNLLSDAYSVVDSAYVIDIKREFLSKARLNPNALSNCNWKIDTHFNSKGYRLLGQIIARRIEPFICDTIGAR